MEDERLALCEERIGYSFQDRELLYAALTHASGAVTRLKSNERLEFLGDAILGLVVCEELYHRLPHQLEGELTRIKSLVVSRETCASVSESMQLQDCLFLGKGMKTQAKIPSSLLSDVFESLVAAIYLDGGWDRSRDFIAQHMFPLIEDAAIAESDANYKSQLQHLGQREFGVTPTYVVVKEEGPDHQKSFLIAARLGDRQFESAWGLSKKQAEQFAAKNALDEIGD